MSNPAPLNDKDRDDLIAFLDQDPSLEEDTVRALEARLNTDPQLRAEAESYRRTWDLLDYLPRAAPSPQFTHRTLDRLAVKQTQQIPRWHRWSKVGAWAAALLFTFGASYWLTVNLVSASPQEQDLVRELRIIENYRFYQQVQELDFLESLDQRDLFGEEPQDS